MRKEEQPIVERLRAAHDSLNCLVDAGGRRFKTTEERDSECEQAATLCWKAATALEAAQAEIERLKVERDEARKLADLGCSAANGGAHSIIAEGTYRFCHRCGETIKAPTLRERARAAESEASALRKRVEELESALRPFVAAFNGRREAYARRYQDRERGYANFDKMPDKWSMGKTIFSMGVFRRARTLTEGGKDG